MEEPNIFAKRLLEKGFSDSGGNKWFVKDKVVYLHLSSETSTRKLGILHENRFILYRVRKKHRFNKTDSYGFSYEVISGLKDKAQITSVDLYDDFGMYRIPIEVIGNGEFLFFQEVGYEKQLFVPIPIIETYRIELEEDKNRRELLGDSWFNELRAEFVKPYWNNLGKTVAYRRSIGRVYPEREDVFKAFKLTPYSEVKVVIIGQDPYHNGCADGLAFSSKETGRFPPSLKKIYDAWEKEIMFGLYLDQNPSLEWLATQGVLLLNTCLTVDEGIPGSHHGIGWEHLMERVLEVLKHHDNDLVFMLWGSYAKALKPRIEDGRHIVLEAEHPAYAARENRAWDNKDCFKKANTFMKSKGYTEIRW